MHFAHRLWILALCATSIGCGIDVSGLGAEGDAAPDTEVTEGDASVDEDAPGPPPDSTVDATTADGAMPEASAEVATDASVDMGGDTVADDVAPEGGLEVGGDDASSESGADTSDDAPVEGGGDASDDASLESGAEAAVDAPSDTFVDTGPLAPSPGSILCNASACTKRFCCGSFGLGLPPPLNFSCGDGCPLGSRYEYACDDKADCGPGQVCCVTYAPFSTTWTGSACRTGCGAAPQLCTTHAECGAGRLCVPQKLPGASFSYGTCT
jgi:hypothetical protein